MGRKVILQLRRKLRFWVSVMFYSRLLSRYLCKPVKMATNVQMHRAFVCFLHTLLTQWTLLAGLQNPFKAVLC